MKILLTGTSYFPEFSAGTEVYMRLMASHLTEAGDSVVIACGGKPSIPEGGGKWGLVEFEHEGIPALRVVRHPQRGALEDPYLLNDTERRDLWKEVFRRTNPDLVFTIGPGPALMGDIEIIANAEGTPIVSTLIHPGQVCPKGSRINQYGAGCMKAMAENLCGKCVVESRLSLPGAFNAACLAGTSALSWLPLPGRIRTLRALPGLVGGFIQRWARVRDSVTCFVAHSEAAYELLVLNGIHEDRILYSTPGFEIGGGNPLRRQVSKPVRFGFVGRICREKGVSTLVDAWRILGASVEAELHFWGNPASGEDDVVASVHTLAAEDHRVNFHGPFNRAQISDVYRAMDVLVVPSEWFDNCPFVIWEAFESGVPVVGSDFGGISTMISDGIDGRLFPMGNARSLANVLEELSDGLVLGAMTAQVRPPRDIRLHVEDVRNLFERCCKVNRDTGTGLRHQLR